MTLPTKPTAVAGGLTTRIVEQVRAALAGRYALERELGRGGMALVFLARDLRDGRLVALKVIHPELVSGLSAKRFRRELALARKLAHPHIVPVLDSGVAAGLLYYVMPYVEGESLRARLRREGPLPLDEALQITREVASALGCAHRRGIVHRDIKPANILLSGGRALVVDFGIAGAVAGGPGTPSFKRLLETGLAAGSPAYMSPEQASGSRRVDPRTDIYSLGCILYEMLGGEAPYTGPTPQAVIAKRLHEPVPHVRALREGLPEAVEQAITRALATAPADRFRTAEEFAAALAPGLISGGAPAESTPPTAPARRLLQRYRRWALAGAGGVIVAAAAMVVSLRHLPVAAPAALRIASPDTRRVVVAAFTNQTGDASLDPLGDIVADYLARGLAQTKLVEVLDARADQSPNASARATDVAGARALANTLGAGSVLWGSYSRRGDSLEFQAQLLEAATGKPLAAIRPAMGSAGQQTEGVEALRQRVMAALAERFDPRLARFAGLGASHAVSYEAYQEFLAGDTIPILPSFAIGRTLLAGPETCDTSCVIAHFRRAYALDTNFTLPIVSAAGLSAWTGGCKQTDSIAEALQPRHDRLPPFDRLQLAASVAHCHGENEKALVAIREAMSLAPASPELAFQYAFNARHLGHLRESIAAIEKLDRALYEHQRWYWESLVIPYHELGDHQRELKLAKEWHRVRPDDRYALICEARALVGLGRLAEVNALVDEATRVPLEAPGGRSPLDVFYDVGRDLRAHGHRQEARALFEQGIRFIEASPAMEQRDRRDYLAALLDGAGRYDEVWPIVKQIAAEKPDDVDMQAWFGAVAARHGDRKEVARIDRWLARRQGPYLNGYHTFQRARLAAVVGDRERAFRLYRQAVEEGAWRHFDDMHADPDFESLRDYPPFQELTRPKE